MSRTSSPVVANWELVLRLQNRRDELGLSVKDLTDHLGITRNYWSLIANERKIISVSALRSIIDILQFDDDDRQKLLQLHRAAKSDGWWHQYSALLDDELRRFYGLEDGAQAVQTYDPSLINGLLQTPDYARAVMQASATVRVVDVEQLVEVRMRRQKRLQGDDPLHLQALISEATLRQQIGGPDVLRGQLDHLLAMAKQDNVDIRVIPFAAPACTLFGAGTLSLLSFAPSQLPEAVWIETITLWRVVTAANPVHDVIVALEEARERALDEYRSILLIRRYRKEVR